jgi:hypothetical protein
MLTLGVVIYGIPITPVIADILEKYERGLFDPGDPLKPSSIEELRAIQDQMFDAEEPFGFTRLHQPGENEWHGYCGVRLGEIDETEGVRVRNLLRCRPTYEQREAAKKKVGSLRPEFQVAAEPIDVYIVWCKA